MTELRWRIQLFGGLKVQQGEQVVTHFESRKIIVLFFLRRRLSDRRLSFVGVSLLESIRLPFRLRLEWRFVAARNCPA